MAFPVTLYDLNGNPYVALGSSSLTSTAYSDVNRLPVEDRDGLAVSGSATSAAVLFTQDMLGYNSITVQITSAGGSCTTMFETTEDQITWYPCAGYAVGSLGATLAVISAVQTLGLYRFPKYARYFRARVSTYGSGTVIVAGTCHKATQVVAVAAMVQGGAAHDAVITGAPIRIGARAVTANYTAVATGDQADLITTLVGAQITKPYSIPEADWSYAAAASGISNTTTAVQIVAAGAAGIRNYITSIQISSDALGAATELAIRDGAGGAVLWRMKIGTAGYPSGFNCVLPSPIKSTAATLLEVVTLTASITGAVFINLQGYAAP